MTPLLVPLHGMGSRQDLPLPFPLVVGGAVAVLALSFVVVAAAWRRPRWYGEPGGRQLAGLTRLADAGWVRTVVAGLGLFGFCWLGLALWFGQDLVTNPVPGLVYVWLWVGLVPASLLLGPVWRTLNPARSLVRLLNLAGVPRDGLLPLAPGRWRRLGSYPAAVGLLAFLWLELVQPDNNTLAVLRAWWSAWVVVVLGGAVLFGRRWVSAAEPFEAYALLVARASPWQRVAGTVSLVNPLRHLATSGTPAGSWAVVAVLLGGTAFDGFTSTSWWVRTTQSSDLPGVVWGTAGLAATVALVAVTLALGVRGLGRLHGSLDALAPSVVPIVVGYAVAHYLSLLVLEGQRTLINASDPLGLGWNVFGTAELGINQLWLEVPQATAVIQLAAIVGGHLAGVLVAHELSLLVLHRRVAPDTALDGAGLLHSIRSQLPLLVVMIGYTCGGLLLLFSP